MNRGLRYYQKWFGLEQHRQVVAQMADPANYPGLEMLGAWDVQLQIYVIPSFEAVTSWTLYARHDGDYTVRRVYWPHYPFFKIRNLIPSTFAADARLPRDDIDELLLRLSELDFPIFKESQLGGIDGVTFGLQLGKIRPGAEFAWWSRIPADAQEIATIYLQLVQVFESSLPAHTHFDLTEAGHGLAEIFEYLEGQLQAR